MQQLLKILVSTFLSALWRYYDKYFPALHFMVAFFLVHQFSFNFLPEFGSPSASNSNLILPLVRGHHISFVNVQPCVNVWGSTSMVVLKQIGFSKRWHIIQSGKNATFPWNMVKYFLKNYDFFCYKFSDLFVRKRPKYPFKW